MTRRSQTSFEQSRRKERGTWLRIVCAKEIMGQKEEWREEEEKKAKPVSGNLSREKRKRSAGLRK